MKNLNLYCPINGTGYGVTSSNITLQLSKLVDVSLFPIGSSMQLNSQESGDRIKELIERSHTYDQFAPCLKIWHQYDLASRIGRGKYFALPFFETDTLQNNEIHHLNQVDHIFTASKWGKEVLQKNGVVSTISVSPLGVDMEIFKPHQIIERDEDSPYIFIHIGKWEKRKSQDFLINAFSSAFTPEDDVELWLLPYNPFLTEEEANVWHNLVINSSMSSKIKMYQRAPTQYHLAQMIYNADCGVFLSRAEGWNNEIPEVMALDKPIIATNYSAHTEYLTKENSLLVDIDELEPAIDGKWFDGSGNWAKLGDKQLEQTVEYMRFVYNKKVRSNPAGVDTAKKYSWERTASIIRETIFN